MRHPEQMDDEFFISNATHSNRIGWKTKRMGCVAYDKYGKAVKQLVPVFVKQSEIKDYSQKLFDKLTKENE